MYPEAPAWPTEEYKNAIAPIARLIIRNCSDIISDFSRQVSFKDAGDLSNKHGTTQSSLPR